MMRHVWTVYCRQIITDKDTGGVSALQLLDGVRVSVESNLPSSDKVSVQIDSVLMTVWARRRMGYPCRVADESSYDRARRRRAQQQHQGGGST